MKLTVTISLLLLLSPCHGFFVVTREIVHTSSLHTQKVSSSTMQKGGFVLAAASKDDDDDEGYHFGDITRGIVGKFQKDVNSLTGKQSYELFDLSKWVMKDGISQIDQRVQEFTNKQSYQFGDITKEIFRRLQNGDYTSEDVWLFVKIIAMIGINIQPIAAALPPQDSHGNVECQYCSRCIYQSD